MRVQLNRLARWSYDWSLMRFIYKGASDDFKHGWFYAALLASFANAFNVYFLLSRLDD